MTVYLDSMTPTHRLILDFNTLFVIFQHEAKTSMIEYF